MFDLFAFAVDAVLEQSRPVDAAPSEVIAAVSSEKGVFEDATNMRDAMGAEYPPVVQYEPASGVLINAEQTGQLLKESYLPYDGTRRFQAAYLRYD